MTKKYNASIDALTLAQRAYVEGKTFPEFRFIEYLKHALSTFDIRYSVTDYKSYSDCYKLVNKHVKCVMSADFPNFFSGESPFSDRMTSRIDSLIQEKINSLMFYRSVIDDISYDKKTGSLTYKSRLLKPQRKHNSAHVVCIKGKEYAANRLALNSIGISVSGLCVIHKNDDRSDLRLRNLDVVTKSELARIKFNERQSSSTTKTTNDNDAAYDLDTVKSPLTDG